MTKTRIGSLLAIACMFVLSASVLQAATTTKKVAKKASAAMGGVPDNIVSLEVGINLSPSVTLVPGLSYERALSDDNSFALHGSMQSYGATGYTTTVTILGGSYRWYLGEHSKLNGFYAGPAAYMVMYSASFDFLGVKQTYSATGFGLGGEGGYQMHLGNGFVVGGGAQVLVPLGITGAGTYLGFSGNVGYAF